MDYTNVGGIAGLVSLVVVVAEKIYFILNHKRIRSNCCGIKSEVSLDIDNTTPPPEKPFLTTPGLITFNKEGVAEQYDAALKKMVPYNSSIDTPNMIFRNSIS